MQASSIFPDTRTVEKILRKSRQEQDAPSAEALAEFLVLLYVFVHCLKRAFEAHFTGPATASANAGTARGDIFHDLMQDPEFVALLQNAPRLRQAIENVRRGQLPAQAARPPRAKSKKPRTRQEPRQPRTTAKQAKPEAHPAPHDEAPPPQATAPDQPARPPKAGREGLLSAVARLFR